VSEAGPIAAMIRRGLTLADLKSFDPSEPIRYADLAVKWGARAHEATAFQLK